MKDVLGILMTGMAVESAMAVTSKVYDLMIGYKKNGIDVVPISELEKAFAEGYKRASSEDSLTSSLIKKMTKGELNDKN